MHLRMVGLCPTCWALSRGGGLEGDSACREVALSDLELGQEGEVRVREALEPGSPACGRERLTGHQGTWVTTGLRSLSWVARCLPSEASLFPAGLGLQRGALAGGHPCQPVQRVPLRPSHQSG